MQDWGHLHLNYLDLGILYLLQQTIVPTNNSEKGNTFSLANLLYLQTKKLKPF